VAENLSPEVRKRRRERRIALAIALIFVATTTASVFVADRESGFGPQQSLLYFGLLYLNLILIILLGFLVTRNLVRAYMARSKGVLGGSLRWKLVGSLLGFSLVPSIVLFAASSYVIRQGFERWFGGQVASALNDSQAIGDVHYEGVERNLDFFSTRVSQEIAAASGPPTQADVNAVLERFPIEAIEVYPDVLSPPLKGLARGVPDWAVPRAATESLKRARAGESFVLIRQFGDGDLVQRFAPVKIRNPDSPELPGAALPSASILVLSHTVPLGMKTRIAELRSSFASYQQTRSLKDVLKGNYTLVLLTLLVLVLFVVTWFGLYIARGILEPVQELLKGTEAFRSGRWDYRIPTTSKGSPGADLEVLKSAFNLMAQEVGQKSRQIEEANAQLVSLVNELEERERYLEMLLSSIRRGVLVLDPQGRIQRVNEEALQFTSREAHPGQAWREAFYDLGAEDEARKWLEESKALAGRPVDRIFEFARGEGRSRALSSVRATGIWLMDDHRRPLGWLMILEDVSDAARLERLAAWQEVARRVAHEIKNPLTPIQISADRLQRRLGPKLAEDPEAGPILQESLAQISKQVRVIRDLVREFSDFARLPEPRLENLDLCAWFEAFLKDYRFVHKDVRFLFENRMPASVAWVNADPEYLRRLVGNLADNAVQSMLEASIEEPRLRLVVGISESSPNFVKVVIEDNGPGIPDSMREKIFDPYVTSKASGLGLGLAIVRRIAIEHMGRVRCEAAQGGRFVLELPLLSAENRLSL
jgi:two-component system nitrogen regulation sensor histidine kinase NtrY